MRDPAGDPVPPGTLFGAAIDAVAEGGFNGSGQPENQWWAWERTGRVGPPGLAGDVWGSPEAALDRAAGAGCEVLALPVEWARIEPAPGKVDVAVLDRYARTLARCAELGMMPVATLHDGAHPVWLGAEYWLTPGSPDRFAAHVELVVEALGAACRHWVTLRQPNLVALAGWVGGHGPPGRVSAVADAWAVMDNLCTAHVLAYDAVHRLQADPVVTVGTVAPGSYEWHRLFLDVMAAPASGTARPDLDAWLDDRRRDYDAALPPASLPELAGRRLAAALSPYGGAGPLGRRFHQRRAEASPKRLADAVYGRPAGVPLDGVVVVWSPGSGARSSRPDVAGQLGRLTGPERRAARPPAPWAVSPDLDGLCSWAVHLAESLQAVPVWVQAGLAMPPDGAARPDGWDRASYLRAVVAATASLAARGAPLAGFLYRDLCGAADPGRTGADLGLFATDPGPDGHGVVWREVDRTGAPAGTAYRHLIAALRGAGPTSPSTAGPTAPSTAGPTTPSDAGRPHPEEPPGPPARAERSPAH